MVKEIIVEQVGPPLKPFFVVVVQLISECQARGWEAPYASRPIKQFWEEKSHHLSGTSITNERG